MSDSISWFLIQFMVVSCWINSNIWATSPPFLKHLSLMLWQSSVETIVACIVLIQAKMENEYDGPCFAYEIMCGKRPSTEAQEGWRDAAAYTAEIHLATMAAFGGLFTFLWLILVVAAAALAQGCPLESGGFNKSEFIYFFVVICVLAIGPLLDLFASCFPRQLHCIFYWIAFAIMALGIFLLLIVLIIVANHISWSDCMVNLIHSPGEKTI